jgi:hypothetical protein
MRTALLFVTILVGCGNASAEDSARADHIGRWSVSPVSGDPIKLGDKLHFLAWRIDTATGNIEVCEFQTNGFTMAGQKVYCTAPTAPQGIEPGPR